MEIWVDGVLHGLGNEDPNAGYYPYPWMCNPQEQEMSVSYPNCDSPHMAPPFPPGDYTGGLPPYSTFLIGCDSAGSCFKGRIDEVRISNVQRTFHWSVVPTVTPTPTQTPVPITGEYAVDSQTAALFHLNYQVQYSSYKAVFEEVSQQYHGLGGQTAVVPNGRYGAALYIDGSSDLGLGTLGYFGSGTVEAWVNLSGQYGSQLPIFATNQSCDCGWALFLGTQSQGTITFGINKDAAFVWADSGMTPANLAGGWHHVAGTWGSRGVEIWIDGVLRGVNSSYTGGMLPQSYWWRAGCDFLGNCMIGCLDEVRVSRVQRTFTVANLARSSTPILSRSIPPSVRDRTLGSAESFDSSFFLFLPFVVRLAPSPISQPCP
jgi:hypothetical protein